jgi:DNA-binding NarL/FixJ family response regulator
MMRATIYDMRRTVVIVDDHEQFRRSARKLLELEGFDVIGEAATGAHAVAIVETLRPDVVLVDVGLPDANGFDVASRLAATAGVVLVSSRDPADCEPRTRRAGALGFIAKDELTGDRLTALLSAGR